MKIYSAQKAIRPKNIGCNGIVVSIDKEHLGWFDKVLHAYCDQKNLTKMLRHLPKISAIEVSDGDAPMSLIIITPKSNPRQFRIDHYTGENNEADFSLLMTCEEKLARFSGLTPNLNQESMRQVANFVIGIHMYEFLMKTDKSVKRDVIVPIEIFGQSLV